ncbi:MAG: 4-hydroxybenzoate octaprenyltransferase [Gammaproteobacteria bacterium]|nr:4-hydroxybenzoate octaprenyltransferase [Gammaproteobacteria bacterium]
MTPSEIWQKIQLYSELIRLGKPIGSYLLLWPALWALAIAAEGSPDPWILFVFVVGVFLMRSAGCAINDYADRDIDLHVKRTSERPLASGKISPKEAVLVFVVLSLLAFLLVLSLNKFTILLSLGGILLAASYPFMKRYHYLPQVHLGAAFSWAIPMAFAAELNALPKQAWLLYVANIIWVTAYDTMYGMADREDDIKIGIKSTAILFGEFDRIVVGLLQGLFILALILIGRDLEFSSFYYYALFVTTLLLIYEQILIGKRDAGKCFEAFLHSHWVGAIVFTGIMGHYYAA